MGGAVRIAESLPKKVSIVPILVVVVAEVDHGVNVDSLSLWPLRHAQHLLPHLPPGHGWHSAGPRLPDLVEEGSVVRLGGEVLPAVQRVPPHGRLVHVLLVLPPQLHMAGVVESSKKTEETRFFHALSRLGIPK